MTFFASVFTGESSSHMAQTPEGKDWDRENEEMPTGREDKAVDQLRNLKVHKSMRHHEIHLWSRGNG